MNERKVSQERIRTGLLVVAVALLGVLVFLELRERNDSSPERASFSPSREPATSIQSFTPAPPVQSGGKPSPASEQALTEVEFVTYEHDFGTIVPGKPVRYAFRFVNRGENPLVIYEVKTSCGCTVPHWPREPIPPGGSGEIVVEFDGSGRGRVQRDVHVFANVKENPIRLRIYATVPAGS